LVASCGVVKFPYHYGSYATKAVVSGKVSPMEFPYHYGSYATPVVPGLSISVRTLVSIPLWFLRNSTLCIKSLACQLNVSIPLWFLRNTRWKVLRPPTAKSFHTTMVLTQRCYRWLRFFHQYSVSIPLWFLRNIYRDGLQNVL